MGIIRVKDIQLYANHGCMVEEGKIGSDYVVNVKLKTDLEASSNGMSSKQLGSRPLIFKSRKMHKEEAEN